MYGGIAKRHWIMLAVLVALAAVLLLLAGRPPICTCGTVEIWHPAIDSGNSQHLVDWYTPSHIVHGFIFYALAWWLMRDQSLGARLIVATLIEAAWEVAENSPFVIDRYRTATAALGYTGDSVINSLADIGWMMLGFAVARRLPLRGSILVVIGLEVAALIAIRDNLTLNVVMLLWPIEAIKTWQGNQSPLL